MGQLDGNVVIVTGAGGGIGRAHALLFAREGAKVVVNDYGGDSKGNRGTSEMADKVVAEITAAGGTAVADANDVATDGAAVVQTALDAFGELHCIVNNAGISGGGDIDEIAPADFDRMLAIHLGGAVAICRAAWPILREQGYGRIVNTSSASVFGLPHTSAYITAKAALFGLTRALAREGRRHDIKVNAIMPAAYSRLTAQSPEFAALMEASFPPEQISPFVGALLSRDVPVTGETFVVGGGRAARVVLATVPGHRGPSTIDGWLAELDRVMASDELVVPADANDEVAYECRQLGIDLSRLQG
ncbi:MAG TPA: SDR family NAD(P)-dependent oxidoreductase [Acidimicrobiales bacterium]